MLLQSALVPVLVRGMLSSHTAERLACGMSHVAVVATQRTKTHSSANSNSGAAPVTRLLTWGKNGAGQLGIGAGREDHFMPQVRLALCVCVLQGVCLCACVVFVLQGVCLCACTYLVVVSCVLRVWAGAQSIQEKSHSSLCPCLCLLNNIVICVY